MNIFVIGDSLSERMLVQKLSTASSSPKVYQWPRHRKASSLSINVDNNSSFVAVGRALSELEITFCINLSPNPLLAGLGNILEIYRIPLFGCNGLSLTATEQETDIQLSTLSIPIEGSFHALADSQKESISYSALVANNHIMHLGATQTRQLEVKTKEQYECSFQIETEIPEEEIEKSLIRPALKILNRAIRYEYCGWLQLNLTISDQKLTATEIKTVADRTVLQTFTACDERDWPRIIATLLEIHPFEINNSLHRQSSNCCYTGVLKEGNEASEFAETHSLHFTDNKSSFTCIESDCDQSLMERIRQIFN